MKVRSVIVLGPQLGIASSMSSRTAVELVQYVLGVFEALFKNEPVAYPAGKADFIKNVLVNGYTECAHVQSWAGVPEVIELQLEELEPTSEQRLDHASFRDVHAHKLIIQTFASTL